MKAYWGVDVQIHIFLTSALAGGEWSASRACRITPTEITTSQVSEQIKLFCNFSIDNNCDSWKGGKCRSKCSGSFKNKIFLGQLNNY
jgi:hypothetical protein